MVQSLFASAVVMSKHLIEVDVLHADVLHHRRFLVDVGRDDAECGAALLEHTCTQHKMGHSAFLVQLPV